MTVPDNTVTKELTDEEKAAKAATDAGKETIEAKEAEEVTGSEDVVAKLEAMSAGTEPTETATKEGEKEVETKPAEVEPTAAHDDAGKRKDEVVEKKETKPDDQAAAELRVQRKKDRELIDSLQDQLKTLGDEVTTIKTTRRSQDDASPEQVFQMLHASEAALADGIGENLYGPDLEKATKEHGHHEFVRSLAIKAITENLSADEITDVVTKANSGMYGAASEHVAAAAIRYLPLAQQRERQQQQQEQGKTEDQEKEQAEARRIYEQEGARIASEMPDVVKEDSEIHKYIPTFNERFLGKTDEKGEIIEEGIFPKDYARAIVARPWVHAQLLSESFKASRVDAIQKELVTITTERDQLRKQLRLRDVPENGSPPVSDADTGERTSADVITDLEEMSKNA